MLRIRFSSSGWTGGPGLGTFYFLSPLEDTAAATAALARVQSYVDYLKSCTPPAVTYQVSGLVDVMDASSGQIINTLALADPASVVGTANPTAFAPHAIAMNATLLTSTFVNGRRVRGRSYVSPLSSGCLGADGLIVPAKSQVVETGLVALKGAGTPDQQLVVWHRPVNGAGGTMAIVTAVTIPSKPAVLRSRRD